MAAIIATIALVGLVALGIRQSILVSRLARIERLGSPKGASVWIQSSNGDWVEAGSATSSVPSDADHWESPGDMGPPPTPSAERQSRHLRSVPEHPDDIVEVKDWAGNVTHRLRGDPSGRPKPPENSVSKRQPPIDSSGRQ